MKKAFEVVFDLEVPDGADVEFVSLAILGAAAREYEPLAVHRAVVSGKYSGKAYDGYLENVCAYFADKSRLRVYCEAVGTDLNAFVDRFVAESEFASKQVGWPFSATDSFARLLADVFEATNNDACKAKCLLYLWDLAVETDQWGARDTLRKMLHRNKISSEVAMPLATQIVARGCRTGPEEELLAHLPACVTKAAAREASRK